MKNMRLKREGNPFWYIRNRVDFLIIRDYYELKTITQGDGMNLAKEKASERAIEDALKRIPKGAKIIDKKFKYDIIKDKGYEAIVYIEVLEDIAEQVELLTN